jgi:hypothetical protein
LREDEALEMKPGCVRAHARQSGLTLCYAFTVRCEVGARRGAALAIYLLSHCASVNKSTLRAARFRFMAIQRLIYLLLLSVLLHSTRGQPTQEHAQLPVAEV